MSECPENRTAWKDFVPFGNVRFCLPIPRTTAKLGLIRKIEDEMAVIIYISYIYIILEFMSKKMLLLQFFIYR